MARPNCVGPRGLRGGGSPRTHPQPHPPPGGDKRKYTYCLRDRARQHRSSPHIEILFRRSANDCCAGHLALLLVVVVVAAADCPPTSETRSKVPWINGKKIKKLYFVFFKKYKKNLVVVVVVVILFSPSHAFSQKPVDGCRIGKELTNLQVFGSAPVACQIAH